MCVFIFHLTWQNLCFLTLVQNTHIKVFQDSAVGDSFGKSQTLSMIFLTVILVLHPDNKCKPSSSNEGLL